MKAFLMAFQEVVASMVMPLYATLALSSNFNGNQFFNRVSLASSVVVGCTRSAAFSNIGSHVTGSSVPLLKLWTGSVVAFLSAILLIRRGLLRNSLYRLF